MQPIEVPSKSPDWDIHGIHVSRCDSGSIRTEAPSSARAVPPTQAPPLAGHAAPCPGFPITEGFPGHQHLASAKLRPWPQTAPAAAAARGAVGAALAPRCSTSRGKGRDAVRCHTGHNAATPGAHRASRRGQETANSHLDSILERQTYTHVTGSLLLLHFWTICLPFISFYNTYIKSYQTNN